MLYKLDAGFGVAKEEHIFAWWTETHRGKTSPQGQCPICLLPLGSPMPSLIRENDKGGRCRGLTSVSHNFFHSDSSFTIGRYIGYRIVGVCTLSAGKSLFQGEARMQRRINQQMPIKCLLLEVGHCLTVCQKMQGLKEAFKSFMRLLALKRNLSISYSLRAPQGDLSCPRAASRRGESRHFSFSHCLPEAPSTPSNGLHRHSFPFITNPGGNRSMSC